MTLPEAAVCTLAAVVLAAVLYPVSAGSYRSNKSVCISYTKQVGLASLMYVSDHDDRFPDAHRWCDALDPFLKTKDVYRCPLISGSQYNRAMHEKLSLTRAAKLPKPDAQISFFESAARIRNAFGDESLFPDPSPHGKGNIVGYADGHAKWLLRVNP